MLSLSLNSVNNIKINHVKIVVKNMITCMVQDDSVLKNAKLVLQLKEIKNLKNIKNTWKNYMLNMAILHCGNVNNAILYLELKQN